MIIGLHLYLVTAPPVLTVEVGRFFEVAPQLLSGLAQRQLIFSDCRMEEQVYLDGQEDHADRDENDPERDGNFVFLKTVVSHSLITKRGMEVGESVVGIANN